MSIPTSLIFVILIAAWLAVLVPMVARRRETVPETEADGSTFRVLRRASASVRRRPKLARRDEVEEDDLMGDQDSDDLLDDEALDEELLDQDEDDLDEDDFDEDDFDEDDFEEVAQPEPVRVGRRQQTVSARSGSETVAVIETETFEAEYYESRNVRESAITGARPGSYQKATEYDVAPQAEPVGARRSGAAADFDDQHLRPIPRRPGRGGYDPDAAEIARAYRYSRRRRITVVLLVATLALSLAAYFVKPILWSGAALFGLLLVAYLGYLRRQVHIEADIRERRLARLARARQIRPEYPAVHDEMPLPAAPFAGPTSQVPPAGFRNGRQIVDLEDDDPSFDDLEFYRPITYRRASGQ